MGEHGMGGWTEQPKGSGRYRVHCTMPDGRRVWRRAKGVRARDRALRELQEAREKDLNPSSLTIAEWLRLWLGAEERRGRIRPRTLDHYRLIAESHIIPTLGHRRLGDLSERHVQGWLDGDKAAPRTVSHHRAVLRRALNVAMRQRAVARNVAIGVDLRDPGEFEGNPLTVADARHLLERTAADRLGPLWRLAIDTGARESELLGLGWDDFDESAGTVRIHAQLRRIPERRVEGRVVQKAGWQRVATKAARDSEVITLMPATVAALVAHRKAMKREQTAEWTHPGHAFTTSTGKPFHGAEVLKAFKAACRKAGIAERRFHDLRASCATILRELGVPEEVRMARLGHATKAMSRHYAQVRDGYDKAASEAFQKALAG